MASFKNFLVVDSDVDGSVLFVRTLRRVFPDAAVVVVGDLDTAISLTKARHYDAILAHRALGAGAGELVRALREADATVPILGVSGIDRAAEVKAAGANAFLNAEEWLRVGTVVASMLKEKPDA